MASGTEVPARKRLKPSNENPTDNSDRPIEVICQAVLAQASTDPLLDSDDDDNADIPTDTVAALNLLKNEFPKLTGMRLVF